MSQPSEATNRSLLFCLLFLVFIAHSHCLPATTTPICEMRAERTQDFFLSRSGCTIQANWRAEIFPDRHWVMAVALLARPFMAAVAKLTAGVRTCKWNSSKTLCRTSRPQGSGLRGLQTAVQSAQPCSDTNPRLKACPAVPWPWYLARKGDNEDWFYCSHLSEPPKTWNQIWPVIG